MAASLLVYSLQLISETVPGCGTGLNFWRQTMWLRCIEIKIFKVRLLIVKLRPFRENKFHAQLCTHFVPEKPVWWESCERAYWCRGTSCKSTPPCSGAVFLVHGCASCFLIRLHCVGMILSAHNFKKKKKRCEKSVYDPKNFSMPLFFFPVCYLLISPTQLTVPKLSFHFVSYSWDLSINLFNKYFGHYCILSTILWSWNILVYKTKPSFL